MTFWQPLYEPNVIKFNKLFFFFFIFYLLHIGLSTWYWESKIHSLMFSTSIEYLLWSSCHLGNPEIEIDERESLVLLGKCLMVNVSNSIKIINWEYKMSSCYKICGSLGLLKYLNKFCVFTWVTDVLKVKAMCPIYSVKINDVNGVAVTGCACVNARAHGRYFLRDHHIPRVINS